MKKRLLSLITAVILLLGCTEISYADEHDSLNDAPSVSISDGEEAIGEELIEKESTVEDFSKEDFSEEGFDEKGISEDPEPVVTAVNTETLIQEDPSTSAPDETEQLLAKGSVSDTISWKLSSDGKLTLSGTGAIPDYETGFSTPWKQPYNDIGDQITSIEIGEGITRIGNWAFAYLFMAESVIIPASVTSIGNSSFFYCASFQTLTIPGSVKTIGDSAFQYCTALQSITFKKGVAIIGSSALSLCTALITVTIPTSVSSLGDGIFSNCSALTTIKYKGTKAQWDKIQFNPPEGFYNTVHLEYPKPSIKSTDITLSKTSYVYTGTARKPSVTVKYKKKTLKKGTDYKVSYSNNVNAGTAKVKITGIGAYEGSTTRSFSITRIKLSSAVLNKKYTSVVYTGKEQKPSKQFTVKAKVNGKVTKLTYGTDYKITYKNNTNVGTATATISGKGNFKGTIKRTFKIIPKAATILAPSGKNSTLTVKWKKQATQTTGYEIQYANNKSFTKNKKTVTVNGSSKTSKDIKNLSTPKKYYVRVRTFKTVSGKSYYSSWSAVKNTYVLAKGMKAYNGHFYKLFNTGITWNEANSKCKSAGGHLVTITNENEQAFVDSLLNSAPTNKNCYWLGGIRDGSSWKWVTKEPFSYTHWARGGNDSLAEDALMAYRYKHPAATEDTDAQWIGKWNDIRSDGSTPAGSKFFHLEYFGYICEWE